MEYFDRLGAALDDAWNARRREEERFPEAAQQVLEAHPPREAFDRPALLDHLLDHRRPVPLQLGPPEAFGQPGFTVFHGHGFVIEIYHWVESLSAIHNHPFCGVFTVLDGFSVHARYTTGEAQPLGGRALRLPTTLASLELLDAGAVVPFSLREHPLVHALIHVPRSSISMVARTVRTEGYLRYLPPAVALPMEAEAEPQGRQLALLDALEATNDPGHAARLQAVLDRADFDLALRVLSGRWPRLDTEARASALDRLRPRLGDDATLLGEVLDRALRLQLATQIREALVDPELRLVAIALGYAERRDQVLALLAARGLDPVATLHRFVDESGVFEGQQGTQVVAHALADGRGKAGALDALRQAFGAHTTDGREDAIDEFCFGSPLAVLTVDEPA